MDIELVLYFCVTDYPKLNIENQNEFCFLIALGSGCLEWLSLLVY